MNPGRCARRKLSRSVTDAACAPTRNPSGASEKIEKVKVSGVTRLRPLE